MIYSQLFISVRDVMCVHLELWEDKPALVSYASFKILFVPEIQMA